ncbi:putative N-acetyltransferase [Neolecta irregularis DAH-3]|uniref:N-alpha-acetyltransferase 40 n=1 Tax=Neolecta irregularis (strain DAH-3) TaxID=1198029 RepID=A0A1U7LLQ6_NEOID|nr:putative N-acetyltransferase [Neolecta irregularis DAH-3]|eukprot:OLL23568.1 putative N-acetyltransferase [Neolecta irregularis DAH-3]
MADDIVNQANHIPLACQRGYLYPRTIEKQGRVYEIILESAESLPAATFSQIFDLFQRNMKEMYLTSSFGWDEGDKISEMREFCTRSLVVVDTRRSLVVVDTRVLGFLNYQVRRENGEAVLQLDESVRGLGIGRELMGRMETIGRKCGIFKAMLTVFIDNPAVNFYYRLG